MSDPETPPGARRFLLGVWRQKPGQRGMTIEGVKYIDQAEAEVLFAACGRYEAASRRLNFQLLGRAHSALIETHRMYANLATYGGAMREVNQRAMAANLMQHTLQWLITARFYVEAERQNIETACGSESEQLARFKKATSHAYDTYAGYRFTYKLRDFAQHGGIPLSGVTIQAGSNGQSEPVPHLRRSFLISSGFRWGAAVRKLIAEAEEVIPVMPMIEQAMEGLADIEDVAARIQIERAAADRNLIMATISRVEGSDGHPAVFSMPPRGQDGETSWHTFPTSESIEAVVRHAMSTGRLDREQRRNHESLTPLQRGAAKRASAAIAALAAGDVAEHQRVVQQIISEDGSAVPLLSGMADIARLLLYVSSTALGSSTEAMLGAVTPEHDE